MLQPRVRRQSGVAIISVLLTVALATIVVSGLFLREHITVRSVENRVALTQSRWVERAAIDWSKVILAADLRVAGRVDHLGEPWAVPVAETRLDETVTAGAKIDDDSRAATLTGQMFDAQSRLNLNILIERGVLNADGSVSPAGTPAAAGATPASTAPPGTPLARGTAGQIAATGTAAQAGELGPWMVSVRNVKLFQQLLDILGQPSAIANAVAQRLLASRQIEGAEDRQVALPLMRTVDLIGLRGVNAEVVEALDPFVTFLPMQRSGDTVSAININTAPAEVLAAVTGVELSAARQVVTGREQDFFNTVEDLRKVLPPLPPDATFRSDMLGVTTQYFLVRGLIRFGRVESFTETLLHRQTQRVEVIWQRRL